MEERAKMFRFLIVRNVEDAYYIADLIRQNQRLSPSKKREFRTRFSGCFSDGFDPEKDFERLGMANQTTMMKTETSKIGRILEEALLDRWGPVDLKERFLPLDTICDATEERQDALKNLLSGEREKKENLYDSKEESSKGGGGGKKNAIASPPEMQETFPDGRQPLPSLPPKLDCLLVVGGFNSSNTEHLVHMGKEAGICTWHIDHPSRLDVENRTILHKPLEISPSLAMKGEGLVLEKVEGGKEGEIVVGVTSGASTPDDILGSCIEKLIKILN